MPKGQSDLCKLGRLNHVTYFHASFLTRWSLANFRAAWTHAVLRSEPLLGLQDFNPWRRGVLLMVTFRSVTPALFGSLTRSSCVVQDSSISVLMITDSPRGELLHRAPVWGRWTVILSFFHFLIIVLVVVALSLNCLPLSCSGLKCCSLDSFFVLAVLGGCTFPLSWLKCANDENCRPHPFVQIRYLAGSMVYQLFAPLHTIAKQVAPHENKTIYCFTKIH